ncbi:MAG: hypothetical protein GX639_05030 [Fibrobacter sp.]|nr:hypothetical protein [Fibrobacter sp.]
MLSIKPARSVQGKIDLPVSPDLFLLASIIAIASHRSVKIKIDKLTPLLELWIDIIKTQADVEILDGTVVTIGQKEGECAAFIVLPYDILPYKDFIVFTLMSIGKVVALKNAGQKRVDAIIKKAKKFGFTVQATDYSGNPGLSITDIPDTLNTAIEIYDDDVASLTGLLLGQKKSAAYMVDFHYAHPVRNVASLFGFEFAIRSTVVKETDPLARRIKMMQGKKKTQASSGQQFQLFLNFENLQNVKEDVLDITLPGDEVLGAMLVTAKCLHSKSSFVINNLPLETWGSPVITLLKKMGCKVSAQETARTSFGSTGMFSIQKCSLYGRKVECRPSQAYIPYLPSMVVLACFAEGQSVFRDLEDLRNDEPDGIDLIEHCIRTLGARHGEMPDGIVVEGGKSFDGFDITDNLVPWLSGSLAVAGLKCMGDTRIEDTSLLQRWPAFNEMLAGICEFRADK